MQSYTLVPVVVLVDTVVIVIVNTVVDLVVAAAAVLWRPGAVLAALRLRGE